MITPGPQQLLQGYDWCDQCQGFAADLTVSPSCPLCAPTPYAEKCRQRAEVEIADAVRRSEYMVAAARYAAEREAVA